MTEYICEHVPPDYEWDGGYDCVYIRKAELIRCKDCKNYRKDRFVCDLTKYASTEDDFCSWAERKEE